MRNREIETERDGASEKEIAKKREKIIRWREMCDRERERDVREMEVGI